MTDFKAIADKNGGKSVPLTAADKKDRARFLIEKEKNKIVNIRRKRNALLRACDWRMLPDIPASQDWINYRQELRDFPAVVNLTDYPNNVVWPTGPLT